MDHHHHQKKLQIIMSQLGDILSFSLAKKECGEDVVEEFRVVVAGAFAVRQPVEL